MRKLMLMGALTTVLLGASASSASATTWSGKCHVEGKIIMVDSPLTVRIEHHDYVATGEGRCDGTLNGRPYNGPVSYRMDGRMNTPMSCVAGTSHDAPAAIYFGDDPDMVDATKVEFVTTHVNLTTQAAFIASGAYNGYGVAHLQFPSDPALLEQCAGSGAWEIDATFDMQTVTPLYG